MYLAAESVAEKEVNKMEKNKWIKYGIIGAITIGVLCAAVELIDELDDSNDKKSQSIYQNSSASTVTLENAKTLVAEKLNLDETNKNDMICDLTYNEISFAYIVKCTTNETTFEYIINEDTQSLLEITSDNSSNTAVMSENEAKKLALDHALLDENDVTFIKIELDFDNNITYYDIEFKTSTKIYEYEINSTNGTIISYEIETINNSTGTTNTGSASYIGEEKAKAIAIAHSKVDESSIKYTKCELDYDDNTVEYEIEFKVGTIEYEYKVNAFTGEITEFDIDYED